MPLRISHEWPIPLFRCIVDNLMSNSSYTQYSAVALHDSFPDGRVSGELHIDACSLIFSWNGSSKELPIKGLDLSWGGANRKLIFFTHSSSPDWTIFTRERSIIKHLWRVGDYELRKKVSILTRQSRFAKSFIILFLLLVILSFYGIWSLKDPAIHFLAGFVPKKWEEKLGEIVSLQLKMEKPPINDPRVTTALSELTEPLIKVVEKSGYKFQLFVVRDSSLNAFALPGGIIMIHSELILRAESPEEILGVLSHEIAHVTERHVTKNIISSMGLYFLFDMLIGDVAGIIAAGTNALPYLLQQKFSRAYEHEADDVGLKYLYEAKINPKGMVSFFRKLLEEEKENPVIGALQESLGFLSTHPATEERINFLDRKIGERQATSYITLRGFEELKSAVKSHLDETLSSHK